MSTFFILHLEQNAFIFVGLYIQQHQKAMIGWYQTNGEILQRVLDVTDIEEIKYPLSGCEQSKIRLANLNSDSSN